jgi:N-methylhydantoinase B/oxoprolinase/acetone carboxylase alpha subunit
VAAYRLYADAAGRTHIDALVLLDRPWENGPGDFKGVGGSVLGDASRVMLMRFETGARPSFHRAVPGFLVVLEGELVVNSSSGDEVVLAPGDAIRVETTGQGGWRLGNRADDYALVALTQMPPKASAGS